jgi:hypothetical protein
MGSAVDSRFEGYETFCAQWRFFLDSYEGGDDYLCGDYLFRHLKEDEESFEDRRARAYYYNFCRTVVDTYIAHLFRKGTGIFRETQGSSEWARFLADVDRKGNDMTTFVQEQVAPAAQIFGHVHVIVDKPPADPSARSRADEEAKGIRPYLVVVHPENLVDFREDTSGELLWARVREPAPVEDDPFGPGLDEPAASQYRTWTRTGWMLHDEQDRLIAAGEHALGRVPLVTVYNAESRKYARCGVSALADIAPINRSVFNWCSLNDEFLYRQCFNILAIPDYPSAGKRRRLGTGNALTFPPDAAKTPHYIYPPVEPGEYLLRNVESAIEQIYRIAVLQAWGVRETRRAQSGVAKAYDFHMTNQNLAKKASNLETAEEKIARVWGLWQGLKDFAPRVEYPSDFSLREVSEDLRTDFNLLKMNISETFNRAIKKRIASSYRKLSDAELARIRREIDGEPPEMERIA